MSDTAAKPEYEAQDARMDCDADAPYFDTDELLRKKVSQIIGFVFPSDLDLESLKSMIQNPELVSQIDQAISEAPKVKDEEGFIKFFAKDLKSVVRKNGAQGTIYAVSPDAPEMNTVERIFRNRDQRIDRGDPIGIILTEEEHKKHQKEGTLPVYAQRFDTHILPIYQEVPVQVSTSPLKKEIINLEMSNQDVITSRSNFNKSSRKRAATQGDQELMNEEQAFVVR
jgi:hypothetical protein